MIEFRSDHACIMHKSETDYIIGQRPVGCIVENTIDVRQLLAVSSLTGDRPKPFPEPLVILFQLIFCQPWILIEQHTTSRYLQVPSQRESPRHLIATVSAILKCWEELPIAAAAAIFLKIVIR